MLTENEIKVILEFLDRATITGHNERQSMNIIVEKLSNILKHSSEEYITEFRTKMEQDFTPNA